MMPLVSTFLPTLTCLRRTLWHRPSLARLELVRVSAARSFALVVQYPIAERLLSTSKFMSGLAEPK